MERIFCEFASELNQEKIAKDTNRVMETFLLSGLISFVG